MLCCFDMGMLGEVGKSSYHKWQFWAWYFNKFFPFMFWWIRSCCQMFAGFIWCYWTGSWNYTTLVSFFPSNVPDTPQFTVMLTLLYCALYRYGFGAYFNILPGSEWSAIMLTYGFPLAIIGMALQVKNFLYVGYLTT